MKLRYVLTCSALLLIDIILLAFILLHGNNITLLNPQGFIALEQKNLIIVATLLMLIVVIPVFILTFTFAWRYRASNTKAKYAPDWSNNSILELIWWAIPLVIIIALAIIIWQSSNALDPFRALQSRKKPLTIQVVALQWKWLFIYPKENIATINYIQFPEKTPINFVITSDAPMNSFWIPSLGGQIYAMSGMETQLHLIADNKGTFNGSSANISGQGFSGMKFIAKASSQDDFDKWVQEVKKTPNQLTEKQYNLLAQPSSNNPIAYYSWTTNNLFNKIIMKYLK